MTTSRRTLMLKLGPAALAGGSVAVGAQANAESPSATVNLLKAGNEESVKSGSAPEFTLVAVTETERIVSRVKEIADSSGIESHSPTETVEHSKAKVYEIDFGSERTTTVTFPISGPRHVELSNLTFVLDSNEQIIEYAESIVTEVDGGLFSITMYEAGELVRTDTIDPNENLDNPEFIARGGVSPEVCVAGVLGVSVVFAAVIINLCGGSCAVPYSAPTAAVCAACIGGVAVIGGASIAGVMGCLD